MLGQGKLPDFAGALQSPAFRSLLARADEFRSRLVRLTVVLLSVWTVAFVYAKEILGLLKAPLSAAMPQGRLDLHFTGPLEVFLSYLHVSFLVAVLLALPYILYQLWAYISPAMGAAHKKYVKTYVLASLVLFVSGMSFCYTLMLPPALSYLVGDATKVAKPLITIGQYTSLVLYMMLGTGLVFLLPIVLIILELVGFISTKTLKQGRGPSLVMILIVAAIVTPTPDPVSQLLMAAPMYVLYEVTIIVIAWHKKKIGP